MNRTGEQWGKAGPRFRKKEIGFCTDKAEMFERKRKGKVDNGCEHQKTFYLVFIWLKEKN